MHNDQWLSVEAILHTEGLNHLPRLVIAYAYVADLALLYQRLHRTELLLERVGLVDSVDDVYVDAVRLQPAERPFDLAHDVIARRSLIVGTRANRTVHLRSDHHVVASAFECTAQHLLRTPDICTVVHEAIHVRAIDQVDPGVERTKNDSFSFIAIELPPEPESQGHGGHLYSSCPEIYIFNRQNNFPFDFWGSGCDSNKIR